MGLAVLSGPGKRVTDLTNDTSGDVPLDLVDVVPEVVAILYK